MNEIVFYIFIYLTDFVINISNISGLSYYEVNFMIFILIYPLLLISSMIIFGIQKWRLYRLRSMN